MELVARRRPKKRTTPSVIALERRSELQDAAIRCIAEKGYAAVTVAMICDAAGFSRGLIGHYFKSKDALVLAAVQGFTRQHTEATRRAVEAAGSNPIDHLHAVVHASFSPPGFTPNQAAVWVAVAGSAKWSQPLADLYQQLWRDYRNGIASLFTRAATQNQRTIDAETAALLFSRMIEGFWTGWVADPGMMTVAQAERACHSLVDLLLS